jgi:hypothetical protein
MEFRKPDLITAQQSIRACLGEVHSSYNDGWTARTYKRDLYELKSWLDDEYAQLPRFSDESDWEKHRIINILKK